jgi:hypothetical protein
MDALKPKYSLFALPIHAHHGSSNCCTSMKAHLAFIDAVGGQDKKMNVVEDGQHEEIMVRRESKQLMIYP